MRLAQIYHKVTKLLYLALPVLLRNEHQVSKLNYCGNMKFNFRGIMIANWLGRGCQCAKGTQNTESSISNDTLKPDGALITSANKETRKLHTVS